jgi:ABC-type cobalamin/Fe3+-siderophores transport system ATPase subunit
VKSRLLLPRRLHRFVIISSRVLLHSSALYVTDGRGDRMIELLGIAMPASRGRWLFRRVSARVERPELVTVISQDREARLALLDAVAARSVPTEGRVWMNGHPLMRSTQARFRSRVAEVDLDGRLVEARSLRWNIQLGHDRGLRLSRHSRLAAERALAAVGLERFADERVEALPPFVRRRALIAQALMAQPEILVVREVEQNRSLSDAADVFAALSVLVSCERLTVFVSTAEPILVQMFAQRVLEIVDGGVRFNGPPSTALPASPASTRPLAATG